VWRGSGSCDKGPGRPVLPSERFKVRKDLRRHLHQVIDCWGLVGGLAEQLKKGVGQVGN